MKYKQVLSVEKNPAENTMCGKQHLHAPSEVRAELAGVCYKTDTQMISELFAWRPFFIMLPF